MTPDEQIEWHFLTLRELLSMQGALTPRRADMLAVLSNLQRAWEQYKTGMLSTTDASALEI